MMKKNELLLLLIGLLVSAWMVSVDARDLIDSKKTISKNLNE